MRKSTERKWQRAIVLAIVLAGTLLCLSFLSGCVGLDPSRDRLGSVVETAGVVDSNPAFQDAYLEAVRAALRDKLSRLPAHVDLHCEIENVPTRNMVAKAKAGAPVNDPEGTCTVIDRGGAAGPFVQS